MEGYVRPVKHKVNVENPTVYPPTLEEALRLGVSYFFDASRPCDHGHPGLRRVSLKPRELGPNSKWRAFGFTDRNPTSVCYFCFKARSKANSEKRWRNGSLLANRERGLRKYLWTTQEGMCAVCFSLLPYNFHVDHIVGLAEGGDPTAYSNLRGLCAPCNQSRQRRQGFSSPLSQKEQARQQLEALDKKRALLLEILSRE